MRRSLLLLALGLALAGCATSGRSQAARDAVDLRTEPGVSASPRAMDSRSRPNILLVVLDDIGFTDLGAWGGIIRTPNLDALAAGGLMLTNFYAAPTCAPTRAMLLTGVDNHVAGFGNMATNDMSDNQRGRPGYEGYLNFRALTLPEMLRDAGYHTYMTGKWHLGTTAETSPAARGFDRSFALLNGGAGAFDNMLPVVGPGKAKYREDDRLLDALPKDFYSTAFYTDRMIEYMEADRADGRPFFAYLAYTAGHWPLQAPADSIARYRGTFDSGYDAYRAERLAGLKRLGLAPADSQPGPRQPGQPSWDELTVEQQRIEAHTMEIYAAMIDDLDRYFGKLLDYLRRTGELEHTVIFVMSDNGPEGHELTAGWPALADWVAQCCDNRFENMGRPDSYLWYGPNWAQASNTPLRTYKGFTSEGGIRVPAFAYFPAQVAAGRRSDALTHVIDIVPTLLDIAGAEHTGTHAHEGREIVPPQGISLLPLLEGSSETVRNDSDALGWELLGKRALRQGDWKIVYEPQLREGPPVLAGVEQNRWQLYDLRNDPSERTDLSATHPERLSRMIESWEAYARTNGVILPDSSGSY